MSIRRATTLGLALLLAAGLSFVLPSAPAGAYNPGVKSVAFGDTVDTCVAGQALPCTPGAGIGSANRIKVLQQLVGGTYRYGLLQPNRLTNVNTWFALRIGAECRTGYKVWDASISRGSSSYSGYMVPDEVVPGWNGVGVSVPDAKVMPTKTVAVNIPTASLFDNALNSAMNHDFASPAGVYAEGEDEIERRMDDGLSEIAARALPHEFTTHVTLHARVICRGNSGAHLKYEKNVTDQVPLTFEYVPVPPPPAREVPRPGGLTTPPRVDEVGLVVQHLPTDPCVVRAYTIFEADRTTDVAYRVVDLEGNQSPLLHTRVTGGSPKLVIHPIGISNGETELGLTSGGGTPGPIDDYADAPTDRLQGALRVRVVSPNITTSNWDGYSIDGDVVADC